MSHLTRAEFIAACAGLGLTLAGCGSTSTKSAASSPSPPGSQGAAATAANPASGSAGSASPSGSADQSPSSAAKPVSGSAPQMLPRFDSQSLLVGEQRVVVILGTAPAAGSSITLLKTGPSRIDAGVYDLATNQKLSDASAPMYADGLPTAYWPFSLKLDKAGSYELRAKISGQARTLAFSVLDRSVEHVPYVGDPLPSIDTPTVTDGRGVNPICTNTPPCPFHTLNLADVLAKKQRVLFYVGTPAYCQTGVCGPGLQFLIDSQKKIASDVAIIHAEVYTDDSIKTTSPTIDKLGLTFEPCLFLVGADGVIAQRVDSVFAAADLSGILSAAGFLAT